MLLFIDTETTGKFNFRLPPEHASQPRVVQLAAVVADVTATVVAQLSLLIQPDGWTVPPEALAVHGISNDLCAAAGVPVDCAMLLLARLADKCDFVVAHNIDFDYGMILGETIRCGRVNPFLNLQRFCTMQAATPVLRIPGPYGNKWPTLSETYRHFFNADLAGAHDALADVIGCMKCFFALRKDAAATRAGDAIAEGFSA